MSQTLPIIRCLKLSLLWDVSNSPYYKMSQTLPIIRCFKLSLLYDVSNSPYYTMSQTLPIIRCLKLSLIWDVSNSPYYKMSQTLPIIRCLKLSLSSQIVSLYIIKNIQNSVVTFGGHLAVQLFTWRFSRFSSASSHSPGVGIAAGSNTTHSHPVVPYSTLDNWPNLQNPASWKTHVWTRQKMYRGADKSLSRPGRKQATVAEGFGVHISYL